MVELLKVQSLLERSPPAGSLVEELHRQTRQPNVLAKEKADLRLLSQQDERLRIINALDEQDGENEVVVTRKLTRGHRHQIEFSRLASGWIGIGVIGVNVVPAGNQYLFESRLQEVSGVQQRFRRVVSRD